MKVIAHTSSITCLYPGFYAGTKLLIVQQSLLSNLRIFVGKIFEPSANLRDVIKCSPNAVRVSIDY